MRFLEKTLSSLALLAAAACGAASSDTAAPPAPEAPAATDRSRHFQLAYEATVKSAPEGAKEVDLWLPIARDTAFQTAKLTKVSAPSGHEQNVEPVHGNKIFHVRVPATSLPMTVTLDYDVTRLERRTDLMAGAKDATLPSHERDRYLAGTPLVPVGAEVTAMANFTANGTDTVGVARQAYHHVLDRMHYDKPANSGWGKGSTEWACKVGFGNCTDFHSYFMSLTRTNGIPARFLMGLSLPTDKKEGDIAGYHCWAEFFAEGKGWIPVDISEADKVADQQPDMAEFYFGGLTVDRVELSSGRDLDLAPKQAGPPLNFFVYPYCEIDGKEAAKDAVARKFAFKDV